jgi:hypothetical protein
MTPVALRAAAAVIVVAILAGVLAALARRYLVGEADFSGLLHVKYGKAVGSLSMTRGQLLASTLIGSAYYVALVIQRDRGTCALPDPPSALLPLLGASHGTYMIGKAWAVFTRSLQAPTRRNS